MCSWTVIISFQMIPCSEIAISRQLEQLSFHSLATICSNTTTAGGGRFKALVALSLEHDSLARKSRHYVVVDSLRRDIINGQCLFTYPSAGGMRLLFYPCQGNWITLGCWTLSPLKKQRLQVVCSARIYLVGWLQRASLLLHT